MSKLIPPVLLACSFLAPAAAPPRSDPTRPVAVAMTEWDRVNLERNLRWVLARERRKQPRPRVAVYADAGVWHTGARSLVELLEVKDVPCGVLDRSQLQVERLREFEVLVIPGGWAPLIRESAGERGLGAIERYVREGGRVVGICAGAYLLAKTVRYEGQEFAYPLGLYDGVAEGPVKRLAPFPRPGSAKLTVTEAGEKACLSTWTAYYSGGPFFHGGTRDQVLARYHDGTAAVVRRPYGRGVVVLCGAHLERSPDGNDDAPAPLPAANLLQALVLPRRR